MVTVVGPVFLCGLLSLTFKKGETRESKGRRDEVDNREDKKAL